MTAKAALPFDLDLVRGLAGDKVFARGEAYFRDGQVQLLGLDRNRASARVAGTETYRVLLTVQRGAIGGECSCRAFEDWGFCKHMVATALAANEGTSGGLLPHAMPEARLRAYLEAQEIDVLVGLVMECAGRDEALFRKLDIAALAAVEDGETLEICLAQAIDQATKTRGFIDYREADGWASGVDAVLEALRPLAAGAQAALARRLALRAIDRIERAIDRIDDSDGHCGDLMVRALEIHHEACMTERPEPESLARELFAREMDDDYGAFSGAAALYEEVLGEAGLAEYRRIAEKAWAALPPRGSAHRAKGDGKGQADYSCLAGILDFFAEREGDVAARIALRAKTLASPWDYCRLAEFCRAQGLDHEALRYAEEGLWIFEDGRPDSRLVMLAADLLVEAGRTDEARAHMWRAFEKQPGWEYYERLRVLSGDAACDEAIALLEKRLDAEKPNLWNPLPDLLIRILIQEGRHDAAWAALRRFGGSRGVKEALARASEKTHGQEALAVYMARVEELVLTGGHPNYEEAVGLIARIASLRGAAAHAAWLDQVKARYRRKRNFMKLLG